MGQTTNSLSTPNCESCPVHNTVMLHQIGVDMTDWDFVIALSGNPNTGKSTVFNALTGLRQHTGNWPGKTITRAEGGYEYQNQRFKIVDLPGTYSLLSTSTDEEVARDFILFGSPDVTVIVVDGTRLERNLNLVLQILEITDRVVVCVNLMDEARRHNIRINIPELAEQLGVPVVPTSARQGEGLANLLQAIHQVATNKIQPKPHRIKSSSIPLQHALATLVPGIEKEFPGLPNARWIALRLLDNDERIIDAIDKNEFTKISTTTPENSQGIENNHQPEKSVDQSSNRNSRDLLNKAQSLRWEIGLDFHDNLMEAIYLNATQIAEKVTSYPKSHPKLDLDRKIDSIVTSQRWGLPLMLILLTLVFWLTIVGANYPSKFLSFLLLDTIHPALKNFTITLNFPWWLSGALVDGVYLATAWVVSVMLPPMAIFFPLFTLLEDLGYLPRVAFNLDNIFKKAGGHGKQALSMVMGFGCNAAGVVATRIIDSPRERLIAILTNNFSLCNGRWPTQILLATIFIGALVPAQLAGLFSALTVVGVAFLGVLLTFISSRLLSNTVLQGEISSFTLELPPYRPPRVWQTIYTSIIDRTLIVLWRATVFAAPAGGVIWLFSNITIDNLSLAEYMINFLNPVGLLIGLNGIILVAYIVAIPANEIVIPTVLMLTVLTAGMTGLGAGAGVLFNTDSNTAIMHILQAGGWTLLTAINLMLFSLIHNPCSTTIYTIYKETQSAKWTILATLFPLALGFVTTFSVAHIWKLVAPIFG